MKFLFHYDILRGKIQQMMSDNELTYGTVSQESGVSTAGSVSNFMSRYAIGMSFDTLVQLSRWAGLRLSSLFQPEGRFDEPVRGEEFFSYPIFYQLLAERWAELKTTDARRVACQLAGIKDGTVGNMLLAPSQSLRLSTVLGCFNLINEPIERFFQDTPAEDLEVKPAYAPAKVAAASAAPAAPAVPAAEVATPAGDVSTQQLGFAVKPRPVLLTEVKAYVRAKLESVRQDDTYAHDVSLLAYSDTNDVWKFKLLVERHAQGTEHFTFKQEKPTLNQLILAFELALDEHYFPTVTEDILAE